MCLYAGMDGFQGAGNHRIVQLRARCSLQRSQPNAMREVNYNGDLGRREIWVGSMGLYEAFNSEPVPFSPPGVCTSHASLSIHLLLPPDWRII